MPEFTAIGDEHGFARAFDEEDDPHVIVDEAEQMIFQIAEDRMRQGFQYIGDVAQRQLEEIEQMAGRPEMITGVPTGFTDFDQMTSGLQRQDLVIIAARPSMGTWCSCRPRSRSTCRPRSIRTS